MADNPAKPENRAAMPPGRLGLSTGPPSKPRRPAGKYRMGLARTRDTLLIVPDGIAQDKPVPLLVMFHGAREDARKIMPFFIGHATRRRFLLMLPQSSKATWDICLGSYGADFSRLEKALDMISKHFAIDAKHFALAGFSDGGSYALSLGLANGKSISHIIVFSGGFMAAHEKTGNPSVFLTHSPEDTCLNIHATGNRLHRELLEQGVNVDFHTFSGGHIIHPGMVEKAMTFFMTPRGCRQ